MQRGNSRLLNRAFDAGTQPQSVYNEELFFLSHDDYVSPGLSVRVMNIQKFMNSKVRHARIDATAPVSGLQPATGCRE